MLVKQALQSATQSISALKDRLPGSASKIAGILMAKTLQSSRDKLVLAQDLMLSQAQMQSFFGDVNKFKNGTPLEYITQKADFYGLEFEVLNGVLIPRPETELLIDASLEMLKDIKSPRICEIGVGSGIISIMLAKLLPNAKITATDINKEALKNAQINAKKFGVEINLIHTNLMDKVDQKFDAIISNPPYIANNYKLDKWVLAEPANALFGGEVGDEILHKIVLCAKEREIKHIACEMGYDQRASLGMWLGQNGYEPKFYKDLAGFDRGFVASKKEKV